jgi:glycosyltransferase involved in cell wall biosynthesis
MSKVIIHIISGLSTGGAEMMLLKLLSRSDSEQFQASVIALVDRNDGIKEKIESLNIPVYILGIKPWSLMSYFRIFMLIRSVQDLKPDLIQGWMYHGNLAATLVKVLSRSDYPIIWNVRHSLSDIRYEKGSTRIAIQISRLFSRLPEVIIYNSNLSCQQHEDYGFHPRRSKYIPNGIEVRPQEGSERKMERIRSEFHILPGSCIVGHVARYHPMKDHQGFLEAAVKIAETAPVVHFVLIGKNVNPHNKELIHLIPEEVMKQFHLLGVQNDIPGLMGMMDVFCLSSAWGEGWSNVLGEAMAAGVPCVATDVGDSKDIIADTGIIVPPRDPKSLKKGIEKLIDMSPAQRQVLGEKARSRIIENFEINKIVDQYVNLYNNLSS